MAKAPITKRTVDAAKAEAAEYVIWDDGGKEAVKGFGLKVTPAGTKVHLFQYRLARHGGQNCTAQIHHRQARQPYARSSSNPREGIGGDGGAWH